MGQPVNIAKRAPMRYAAIILYKNLSEIDTVAEWASIMRWRNVNNFSKAFREYHDKKPVEMLVQIKVQKAILLLKTRPDLSCYEISLKIGKLDEKALNKFLKFHTGLTPSHFKSKRE